MTLLKKNLIGENISHQILAVSKSSYSCCYDWKAGELRCWFGQEMLVDYILYEDSRVTTCFKKALEKLGYTLNEWKLRNVSNKDIWKLNNNLFLFSHKKI